MGDEMDACYCVWQLLSFIRDSQNHCTDTECFNVPRRGNQQVGTTGGEDASFTMMFAIMMLAVIMHFISPQSVLKFTNSKSRNNENNDNGDSAPPPPPAPPAVN